MYECELFDWALIHFSVQIMTFFHLIIPMKYFEL